MINKETRTTDRFTDKDAGKGIEHENLAVTRNLSLLDLWNDYVETNKKLYRIISEDIQHKMVPFLHM